MTNPMKRYLAFSGECYYPLGGMDDFNGSADTVEEAMLLARAGISEWWHIWDSETGEFIHKIE